MNSYRRAVIAASFAFLLVPVAAFAHSYGPPPPATGDPQKPDNGLTCSQLGCHTGTPVNVPGAGSVTINAGGTTYTPGQTLQISVTIADAAEQAWGFQLTARVLSNNTQAGTLNAGTDGYTWVQCADGSTPSPACSATFNTQFIQHTMPKTGAKSGTFTFSWTAPSSSVGTVILYAAGNAASGNAGTQPLGDHIYTTSLQLTAASPNAPSIGQGGVVPVWSTSTSISSGSLISIYGTNLASAGTSTSWDSSIVNGKLPTNVGGVTVSIGGKPAYVAYISPGQINAQAPDFGTQIGTMGVTVTNASGTSNTASVTVAPTAPSFLLRDGKHVTGYIPTPDGSGYYADGNLTPAAPGKGVFDFVGPGGTTLGFNTRPAKKGEVVVLYGVGFGLTNPPNTPGQVLTSSYPAANLPAVTIGGIQANVQYAAVTFAGVFQINVQIPTNAPSGDLALVATAGSVQTTQASVISVQ